MFTSADLSRSLWAVQSATPPNDEVGLPFPNDSNLVLREANGGQESITPVGPVAAPGHVSSRNTINYAVVGASSDLSRIFLSVADDDDQLWPGDSTEAEYSLYEYSAGAREPVLVGVKNEGRLAGEPNVNDGAELESKCGTTLGFEFTSSVYNAISTSGEVVYFTARACPKATEGPEPERPEVGELYARIGGAQTVAISEPTPAQCAECVTPETVESGRRSATYQGASEDGSRVWFTSEQALISGAHGEKPHEENLYEYDQDAPAGRHVSLVAPDVRGVARISEDGGFVYFASTDQLEGAGEAGGYNLYAYDANTHASAFVATLLSKAEAEAATGRKSKISPACDRKTKGARSRCPTTAGFSRSQTPET